MEEWQLSIAAGFLLSLIHVVGPRLEKFVRGRHIEITSLSAGMFLSYIFLEGFGTIADAHVILGKTVLLAFFLGFASYHILSKYLYQHEKDREKLKAQLDELRYAGAVLDATFTGFALAIILDINQPVYFALAPFILHTFSATLAFQAHHKYFKTPAIGKILLAFSPLLGAVIGEVILFETGAFYRLLAFVTGAVLYIAVRHMLPGGERGDLKYFIIGAAIGIAMLLL